MLVSFDSRSCSGRACTRRLHFTDEETEAKRRREAELQPRDFPYPLGQAWSCPFRAGTGAVLPPEAPGGPAWLSGPQPALAGRPPGEKRLGRRCAQQQDRRGPCPHGSCLPGPVASQTDRACEIWGPPRRAWLLQQLLKGLIVAGGPSVGSCPRGGRRQSPAFVPALPPP